MAKKATQKPDGEDKKPEKENRKRRLDDPPEGEASGKRRKASSVRKAPQFFKGPDYTNCGPKCGGKLSTAVLGPNAYLNVNTDADSKMPFGITKAKEDYPECNFKAGHLLNATFGGNGKDPNNLIILTASANGQCNKFDNKVKQALAELYAFYDKLCDYYADISPVKFGILVKVKVYPATWGDEEPECWIHNSFCMSASTVDSVDVESLKDSNGAKLVLTNKAKKDIEDAAQKVKTTLSSCAKTKIDNTLK